MAEVHSKRTWMARLLQFDLRFMLFATAVAGIAILWWQDRQRLEQRLAAIELRYKPISGNAWSVEQATGAPDTPTPGDQYTAWASATPDGQDEWLELCYQRAVRAHAVEIHESYNPGAVVKVTAFDASGKEVVLWQGTDPTSTTKRSGISKIDFKNPIVTDRIRLHLDSKNVVGWNEIDAVGLHYGMFDFVMWADKASASSNYGQFIQTWQSGSFSLTR